MRTILHLFTRLFTITVVHILRKTQLSTLLNKMWLLLLLFSFEPSHSINMNQNGLPYQISNAIGPYNTDLEALKNGRKVEHFDVYGEVRTLFSQVYWTTNNPINLPKELVDRFKGKIMAITGYEVDQVTHSGPQIGSTTDSKKLGGFSCYPDCSDTDTSIPLYNAYNHHYFSWLVGSNVDHFSRPNGFPTRIVFKENSGGEFRKSYHGYPAGYAQLIESPDTWEVQPMQIDVHDRTIGLTDQIQPTFEHLPQSLQNSMTDLQSGFNPVLECPCTDRISKSTEITFKISDNCLNGTSLNTLKECQNAVNQMGFERSVTIIENPDLPNGCILHDFQVLFNPIGSKPCKLSSQNGQPKNGCICQPQIQNYLTYMDGIKFQFHDYDCGTAPRSDMTKIDHGKTISNPACSMDTYHGGTQCCRHSWFLTDRSEDHLIPKDQVDIYFLKWRLYFQEYQPENGLKPASHQHLHHFVFWIDGQVDDYEEDNPHYGTKSVGKIEAKLKVKDMGLEDLAYPVHDGAPPVPEYSYVQPIVMTPHCHAPSCIRYLTLV